MDYEVPRMGVPYLKIPASHRWMAIEYGVIVKPKNREWKYADYCYAGKIRLKIIDVKEMPLWKVDSSLFEMEMVDFMYQWQKQYWNWNDNPMVYVVKVEPIGVR